MTLTLLTIGTDVSQVNGRSLLLACLAREIHRFNPRQREAGDAEIQVTGLCHKILECHPSIVNRSLSHQVQSLAQCRQAG
jgi:hypothetical protein